MPCCLACSFFFGYLLRSDAACGGRKLAVLNEAEEEIPVGSLFPFRRILKAQEGANSAEVVVGQVHSLKAFKIE